MPPSKLKPNRRIPHELAALGAEFMSLDNPHPDTR